MAGEKCTRKFWKEVRKPSGQTRTVCKEGGKRKASMYGGATQMEINRDRTVVTNGGDIVKRYVWSTPIATYNRMRDTLILKDGGHHTRLTKGRLNQVLKPLNKKIKQKDFNWYINGKDWITPYRISQVSKKLGRR